MKAAPIPLFLAIVLLGACDAQVSRDYRGERLVTLRGNVLADTVSPAAEAALLWWSFLPARPFGTRAKTEGAFPAGFTLSVYRSPPERALLDLAGGGSLEIPGWPNRRQVCRLVPGRGRLALASIAAVLLGSAEARLTESVVGLAAQFALVYAAAPVEASFLAGGRTLTPGYHLMRLDWADDGTLGGALECAGCDASGCGSTRALRLREAEDGLAKTELEVSLRTR